MELKKELESYTASSPTPSGGSSYVSLQPFKQGQGGGGQGGDTPTSSSSSSHLLGKSAAITGKLEVRLMGCQDLLEDVPGRSRRDSTHSAPNDLKSFVKGTLSFIWNTFLYFLNGIVDSRDLWRIYVRKMLLKRIQTGLETRCHGVRSMIAFLCGTGSLTIATGFFSLSFSNGVTLAARCTLDDANLPKEKSIRITDSSDPNVVATIDGVVSRFLICRQSFLGAVNHSTCPIDCVGNSCSFLFSIRLIHRNCRRDGQKFVQVLQRQG